MEIIYLKGDATAPLAEGNKIIVHVCNDIGGWGKGFVMALSKKWKDPEEAYRKWHKESGLELGHIQLVQVETDLWVCNLVGQRDIRAKNGIPPIRYEAMQSGLAKLALEATKLEASIHMPRIGCGLAGGKWGNIEPLIQETLMAKKIPTTVYDFG